MSIYSGFPTRRDESNYNVLLSRLISLLQTDLLELLNGNVLSEKKVGAYWKVISKMRLFEEHKYLPPKFSDIMEPLANLCGFSAKTNKPNINDIEPSDVSVTRFQS